MILVYTDLTQFTKDFYRALGYNIPYLNLTTVKLNEMLRQTLSRLKSRGVKLQLVIKTPPKECDLELKTLSYFDNCIWR